MTHSLNTEIKLVECYVQFAFVSKKFNKKNGKELRKFRVIFLAILYRIKRNFI